MQMQGVRDAARQGGMDDDTRREAAARMAMQLFQLMGGEDGEGEGSDQD